MFIVFGKENLLPELAWLLSSFGSLDVEIAEALLLANGCVLRVGEWAGLARAEASDVVLVPAKGLGNRSMGKRG